MAGYRFPKDFIFGTATAAYQVEGAAREDGRGESIWDRFSHTPGKIKTGETGDVACDHYHRVDQDIALMKAMNMGAYRFSVAWTRILPEGEGPVNQKGLDWYSRLVDKLLAAGLVPFVTMYHWDLPQALEERHGGWRSRKTPEAFARYAEVLVRALGDRVKNWIPLNEMPATIIAGYGEGFHAPGARETRAVLNQIQHNCLLAHGYAARAVHGHGSAGSEVGTAHNARVFVPAIETKEHIEATRKAFEHDNGPMLEPMTRGTYPAKWLEAMGSDAPKVDPGDMEIISERCEFIGLNVYRGLYVEAPGKKAAVRPRANVGPVENVGLTVLMTPSTAAPPSAEDGYNVLPFPASYPRGAAEWVLFVPQAIYWGVRMLNEVYGYEKLYITENGTVGEDKLTADGRILDLDRLEYYRLYLLYAQRACAEKYPLKGYFAWSLMDNFEWSEGYGQRFGLHYVDYQTQERTPKLSARFYAAVAKNRRVV